MSVYDFDRKEVVVDLSDGSEVDILFISNTLRCQDLDT